MTSSTDAGAFARLDRDRFAFSKTVLRKSGFNVDGRRRNEKTGRMSCTNTRPAVASFARWGSARDDASQYPRDLRTVNACG